MSIFRPTQQDQDEEFDLTTIPSPAQGLWDGLRPLLSMANHHAVSGYVQRSGVATGPLCMKPIPRKEDDG
jgi:hypothetical protein